VTKLTSSEEQDFLDELDKKLWNAADRLRSNLDAAAYKHVVLGLIFLKYISDRTSTPPPAASPS
jgi:type I restriction enzyme M protein